MADIVIYNPWDVQCVYTEQGHMIGGGERRTVQDLDSAGRHALRNGWIIIKKGVLPPPPLWPAEGETPSGEAPDADEGGGEGAGGEDGGSTSQAAAMSKGSRPKQPVKS